MWTWLIGLAIVAGMIGVIVHRGLQMKRLVEDGRHTTGTVVRMDSRSGTGGGAARRYLVYAYRVDGRKHSRRIHVSDSEADPYQEGSSIEIVYLPDRPQVSGTLAMVELLRGAKRG